MFDTEESLVESWCHTKVKSRRFTHTWTITNFSLCLQECGKAVTSSIFPNGTNEERKWRIKLYPRGENEDCKDFISIFLGVAQENATEVRAKFKFSILDQELDEIYEKSEPVRTFGVDEIQAWGYYKFVDRDFLMDDENGLLHNDKLIVFCEVVVVGETVRISGQSNSPSVQVSQPGDDFGKLLESGAFSDVTLCIDGQELPAHKAILGARSPVFRAMFETEMVERSASRVEIVDIGSDVMGELLRYIYTGKATNLEKMADRLLAAADKYALVGLKTVCSEALRTSLSVDNFAETLVLSDMHSAGELKLHVINFINSRPADIMEAPTWQDLIRSHPTLVVECLRVIANLQCQPSGAAPRNKSTKSSDSSLV